MQKSFEVTIAANDKQGGTFSFGQTFLLLDEGINPEGEILVTMAMTMVVDVGRCTYMYTCIP